MKIQHSVILWSIFLLPMIICGASVEKDTREDDTAEDRRHRRRKNKRPCGRSLSDEKGRTFLDWSYSYLNINHNYNINCGIGAPMGGSYLPPLRPGHHNHHHGNKFGNELSGLSGSNNNYYGNRGNKWFGLGIIDLLLNTSPSGNVNKPSNDYESENLDSDNNQNYDEQPDDKPVSENYDDVPLGHQNTQNFKPGQYVSAYNPLFGNYVQDISNFKPQQIIKQVNKDIDKFFRPFYSFF